MREGAGVGYEEIAKVDVGDTFPLLDESAGWYKIEFDSKEGWISSTYAKKTQVE